MLGCNFSIIPHTLQPQPACLARHGKWPFEFVGRIMESSSGRNDLVLGQVVCDLLAETFLVFGEHDFMTASTMILESPVFASFL